MKFMSLLVAFCFSLNVMAASGLESAVNEYQYALSVEWDQKDAKFYDAKTVEFFNQLKGVSKEEMLAFADSKLENKAAVDALKLKLSVLSQANSAQELAALVRENSKDFYARGASWNGETMVSVAIVAVIVGVIAYAVWWDANHVCTAYGTDYVCRTYGCGGGYYGGSYYGGYYGGYGSCYTSCGYQQVCTNYERKE